MMCVTLKNRQSGLPRSALAEESTNFAVFTTTANARSCADLPEGHALRPLSRTRVQENRAAHH